MQAKPPPPHQATKLSLENAISKHLAYAAAKGCAPSAETPEETPEHDCCHFSEDASNVQRCLTCFVSGACVGELLCHLLATLRTQVVVRVRVCTCVSVCVFVWLRAWLRNVWKELSASAGASAASGDVEATASAAAAPQLAGAMVAASPSLAHTRYKACCHE